MSTAFMSYAQPTKSSKLKSKGLTGIEYQHTYSAKPKNIADRINELIKNNGSPKKIITAEPASGLQNKENTQISITGLQAQIDALKSAFNTLAEVVVDEMNKTKQEILTETSQLIASSQNKRDEDELNKITLDLSNVAAKNSGSRDFELSIRRDLENTNKKFENYKNDTQYFLARGMKK